jgi:uncharacterized protein (TIGR04255 family)
MSKLPKAPLQEAICELKWQLQPDESGKQLIDPEFVFALGKFDKIIRQEFPFRVSKFPSQIPSHLLQYQAMHQFWKAENTWPVVQLGPGIVTVNDTEKNYEWSDTYLPNILKTLDALGNSYGNLQFNSLSLRYIDVVRVADYGFKSWEQFVHKHLNFEFNNRFDSRGELAQFHFEQSFEIKELGMLNLAFNNSLNNKNEDIFIWQTAVYRQSECKLDDIQAWLTRAHDCTSEVFKDICKNDFYASFTE